MKDENFMPSHQALFIYFILIKSYYNLYFDDYIQIIFLSL